MDIASAYDSPWLIAVNRVLLRLPVPRHSPCALYSLTYTALPLFENLCLSYFHSMKYCNITLFRYTLQISFKDGLCNVFLFSSHLAFFSLFSFQGTIFFEFFKTQSSILNFLNTEVWILTSLYSFPLILFQTRRGAKRCTYVHASDHNEVWNKIGGLKWTRTTDLPLIRRTL